jgi:hypothetical protein
MKFGPRKPSLRKSLAAKTSFKRVVRHSLGLKAPKGWGWLTNPKKAAYNKAYNKTSFSLGKKSSSGCMLIVVVWITAALIAATKALWP